MRSLESSPALLGNDGRQRGFHSTLTKRRSPMPALLAMIEAPGYL
jgi:hypothetical protein